MLAEKGVTGSSPRARGTLVREVILLSQDRIIPASAGNSAPADSPPCARPDHPRERGELDQSERGAKRRQRIIPASAGNSAPTICRAASSPDHPRERGELSKGGRDTKARIGSSPRARGTRAEAGSGNRGRRIIPASAGELYDVLIETCHLNGSSPRARGTLRPELIRVRQDRIIPASAGNSCRGAWTRKYLPDHPRERGELIPFLMRTQASIGSSPRARGTRDVPDRSHILFRIIPASAGNSCNRGARAIPGPDHPRERGELANWRDLRADLAGSSPRARGTRLRDRRAYALHRIIPASAGNSFFDHESGKELTDHPRERGELASSPATSSRGSRIIPASAGNSRRRRCARRSPPDHPRRARGTRHPVRPRDPGRRIIPASAGNSGWRSHSRTCGPDHPRERGELNIGPGPEGRQNGSSPRARGTRGARGYRYRLTRIIPASAGELPHPKPRRRYWIGSSPRARGTQVLAHLGGVDRRIIPASAGNSCAAKSWGAPASDHPRESGELLPGVAELVKILGSSPRARGTRGVPCRRAPSGRIIPASAGNSRAVPMGACLSADHPRERGELSRMGSMPLAASGSSPRARGTQYRREHIQELERIIPASAGNS